MPEKYSRRSALGLASATAAAAALSSTKASAADGYKVSLQEGQTILFQGDSITDCRRDRKHQRANDPRGLGSGYPAIVAAQLLSQHAELGLKIHNRGISGNKVPDLAKRWKVDCLDLKPDVVSILIGVNDIWHKLNGRYDGTPEAYRDGYYALLEETMTELPDATVLVCEPFVMRCGAVTDKWFPEFETRRAYAEQVAREAGAIWVPFQKRLDMSLNDAVGPAYWAPDGVHPSQAGHGLMADEWLKAIAA